MKGRHILLISYVFPPYPGIGGRRWAKMAKYLARAGYTVHVLTAQNPFDEESLWTDDVKSEHIKVYPLPGNYPVVLLKKELSLWDKFAYRYWLRALQRKYKGSIYDRALAWKPVMHEKAVELIRTHNISNIIATGAPFRALLYATELKKEFSSLNVIVDFRDPWTAGKSYGFGNMSSENKSEEVRIEGEVIRNADKVLSPAQEILDDLSARYGRSEKYVHLPHAFDPDDYSEKSIAPLFSDETISFAFTGTIYNGLEKRLQELASKLKILRQEHPAIYNRVRFDFYTSDERHAALFTSVSDVVRFLKPLSPALLFATLRQYKFALVLFTEQYKEFLSTKFWELFHLRLPVIYLGPEGRVAEFLRTHDLGIAFTKEQAVDSFISWLENYSVREFRFNIDTSQFSCAAMVRKLEEHLQ